MNDVVGEALGLLHNDIQHRGVVVTTSLCAPAPTVFADRVQLQQVLLNLIVNACDAMNDTPPDERRLVVTTSRNGDARIEVSDRGSGFASQALASAFEPFVTTKRDGLGLGLAICRSIITAHRGRMWARNNQDRGATLVVALPLAAEER
jgi:C4-dicarboxylate-specific signal transduction histidine kinase